MIITLVRNVVEPKPENPGEEIWRGGYKGLTMDEVDQLPAALLSMRTSDLDEGVEVATWYPIDKFKELFTASKSEADAWSEVTVPVLSPEGGDNVLIQVEQNKCCDMLVQAVLDLTEYLGLWREERSIWIRVE